MNYDVQNLVYWMNDFLTKRKYVLIFCAFFRSSVCIEREIEGRDIWNLFRLKVHIKSKSLHPIHMTPLILLSRNSLNRDMKCGIAWF